MGQLSMLMFWAMIEIGVALVAANLPILRPLLYGWSPRSIIYTIRSFVSGRSGRGSGSGSGSGRSRSSRPRSNTKKSTPKSDNESERAIVETLETNPKGVGMGSIDVEAWAMGRVDVHKINHETYVDERKDRASEDDWRDEGDRPSSSSEAA